MAHSDEILCYPSWYPPERGWKKFFLGVRWIGPDLCFFSELKKQQASRAPSSVARWGGGLRQELAVAISEPFSSKVGWHTSIFYPEDHLIVVAHGPNFDSFNHEEIFMDCVTQACSTADIDIPDDFFQNRLPETFGEFVDSLVSRHRLTIPSTPPASPARTHQPAAAGPGYVGR